MTVIVPVSFVLWAVQPLRWAVSIGLVVFGVWAFAVLRPTAAFRRFLTPHRAQQRRCAAQCFPGQRVRQAVDLTRNMDKLDSPTLRHQITGCRMKRVQTR